MSKRLRCDQCGHIITEQKVVEIAQKAARKEILLQRSRKGPEKIKRAHKAKDER